MPRRFIHTLPALGGLDSDLLRQVNRAIAGLASTSYGPLEYVCECGDTACQRITVMLRSDEIDEVLASPDCYLMAAGHDRPGSKVVRYGDGYLIVRRAATATGARPPGGLRP